MSWCLFKYQRQLYLALGLIIVLWNLCLTTDWTTGVRSPTEGNGFSSSLCVQTSSEAHPAFYPVSVEVLSGGKVRPGHDADNSPPYNAEVKYE
jgi:hypothetical protein